MFNSNDLISVPGIVSCGDSYSYKSHSILCSTEGHTRITSVIGMPPLETDEINGILASLGFDLSKHITSYSKKESRFFMQTRME